MRNKKYRFEQFSLYDHTGIAAHMEKMAAKGWLIEKIGPYAWRYRRISPQQLRFTVTYYPSASLFDPAPSEGEQTFHEFCASTGWVLAASSAQLQIFYNEAQSPVPIETDALLQVENVNTAMKRALVLPNVALLALCALYGGMALVMLNRNPAHVLANRGVLLLGMCAVFLLIIPLGEMGCYYLWYRRAKRCAERDGTFVRTRGTTRMQLVLLALLLLGLVGFFSSMSTAQEQVLAAIEFLRIGILIGMVIAIRELLKRRKVSKGTNMGITLTMCFFLSLFLTGFTLKLHDHIVDNGLFAPEPAETYQAYGATQLVYRDELPLKLGDLMEADAAHYSYEAEKRESALVSERVFKQLARLDVPKELSIPDLHYTIYEIKAAALYEFCLNGMLRLQKYEVNFGYSYVPADPTPWGAEHVYQVYRDDKPVERYVVCWTDRIVRISFYWGRYAQELTQAEIATVAQLLRTA